MARPFRVWNFDRSLKKSITASSLQELIEKGSSKLSLRSSTKLQVVLEEDGTQVDEEDYFTLLPGNCTFMFLENNEQWKPADHLDPVGIDETDQASSDSSNMLSLACTLRKDLSNIMAFSREQLQQLVDCDVSLLAHAMEQSERRALAVQRACQRYLDEYARNTEAIDILQLYHQASNSIDDQAEKKRKIDTSL